MWLELFLQPVDEVELGISDGVMRQAASGDTVDEKGVEILVELLLSDVIAHAHCPTPGGVQ